jgi:hypothetical protein
MSKLTAQSNQDDRRDHQGGDPLDHPGSQFSAVGCAGTDGTERAYAIVMRITVGLALLLVGCGTADEGTSDEASSSASTGAGASSASSASSSSSAGGSGGAGAWSPPIGIPEPPFGIHESADACTGCTPRTQSDLGGLEAIPAGTIVELSGGPFDGDELVISGTGTAELPIFVRGAGDVRTVIRRATGIVGSFIIVENIDFDFSGYDRGVALNGDHLALRHSDVHGVRAGSNGTVVVVHQSSDVVIHDNHVWDNGDFSIPGELDIHGIGGAASWRIWIVDNHLHQNRGDSIQFGHQAGNSLGDIYIGRNDIHDDGENCVDIKEASNVVISENVLHAAAPTFGNIVLHDCPLNAAVIYNEIHDELVGVSMASLEAACLPHQPVSLLVVRNQFHDIGQNGVQGWGSGKRYYVSGNSFASVATPISIDNADSRSVIDEGDAGLAQAFDAFFQIYGIDIANP